MAALEKSVSEKKKRRMLVAHLKNPAMARGASKLLAARKRKQASSALLISPTSDPGPFFQVKSSDPRILLWNRGEGDPEE